MPIATVLSYSEKESHPISLSISRQDSGFKMSIRIDKFSAFIRPMNAEYRTKNVHMFGTDWFLQLCLGSYNPIKKRCEKISLSERASADALMFFICAKQNASESTNDCSFDVRTVLNFKPTVGIKGKGRFAKQIEYLQNFCFNSGNNFCYEYCPCFIKLKVCFG